MTIWIRHFLDSAQVIDFIDKNEKTVIDSRFWRRFSWSCIISILSKDRKIPLKVKLVEKSSKKAKFLNSLIDEFQLNAEVINKNIFEYTKKISGDVFVARAFKPLKIILPLIHNKVENWKKIFVFLGKTGKNELLQASKSWHIEYKQRDECY